MTKYVRKRDGSFVAFQREKIAFAIQRAMEASCPDMTVEEMEETAEKLAEEVEFQILNDRTTQVPSVEAIQDEVEKVIIRHNLAEVAKAYILYRKKRQMIRESANSLSGQLKEIFDSSSIDSDLKRDNANVDGNSAMGTMLQVGAAASKLFFSENYLTEEQKQANQCGDIHIHDFDFYALTETCCQIDFKALAECGFSTGHGFIRPPQSIQSYAALACIAIQANQNDQHGGQSIPNFDYAMAQGVKKTYAREFERILCEYYEEMKGKEPDEEKEFVHQILTDIIKTQPAMVHHEKFDTVLVSTLMVSVFGYMNKEYQLILDEIVARIHKKAYLMTEKATHQAMESLVHNLNSMHSRAGAQVPFSSLNYGPDTSAEGRMAIRQLLLATEEGLGNGETPIFPIQIFKVKEGVNYNEGDPNYDLFRLAMKVSAKRLFPNFTFIDAPFNLQYYVPGHPETEVATMGCRTRVRGMARDNKKHRGLSDGELREMFMDIGRSKEETARSIVEKQRQEEEERHKRFRNRLFHSKSIEIDDDVDIDEETAALEREIELVRAGKIHKYLDQSPGQEEGEQAKLPETVLIEVDNSSSQHMVYADVQKEPEDSSSDSNQSKENEGVAEEPFADSEAATSQTVEDTPVCNKSICDIDVSLNVSNDMAPQGEERPSAEENHLDLRGVFDPEEEISFLFDDNPAPSDEAPAPEEAEDFELIDAAIVSDAGYFAVTYDANSNSGTFAFALETQGDRRFHESTVEECKNIEQATFEGAAALLEEIKNSGYTSIIIHMDKESCALLRRNAIYGIVDEYSESCIKYIQKAKEIVLKCHIRLTDETWTTEQIVTQSLVEGMAKKAIK